MTTSQKLHILKQHPLFKDIPEKELLALAEIAKEEVFPPHTIIINQSLPPKDIFLIHKGLIRIYIVNSDGKVIPIRVKGPLYITGDANLADDVRTATIESVQETHALAISMEEMRRLFFAYPIFAFNFLRSVIEKLRAANNGTNYYFSTRLKQRTLALLQDLALHFPNRTITLSQEELADIIGATRAKVTLVLQKLQEQGVISIQYKKTKVL